MRSGASQTRSSAPGVSISSTRAAPACHPPASARRRCWRRRRDAGTALGLEHHVDWPGIGRHCRHIGAVDDDAARSGVSNPAISRSSVVLPQPDGPSSAKNSPRSIDSDTRSTAGAAVPNRLLAWMISRSAIDALGRLSNPISCGSRRGCGRAHRRAAPAGRYTAAGAPPRADRCRDRLGSGCTNGVAATFGFG